MIVVDLISIHSATRCLRVVASPRCLLCLAIGLLCLEIRSTTMSKSNQRRYYQNQIGDQGVIEDSMVIPSSPQLVRRIYHTTFFFKLDTPTKRIDLNEK